ncbi:MAG: nuclear transport factor 2 family protein [Nitriliruptorales bacterium]|nr:nuclear transport factor 2 family protein [Nitriliruptorales bacterium]
MSATRRFRTSVEARDLDAVMELFAEDATFHSPVVFKPYEGRDAIRMILESIIQVLPDLHYIDELTSWDRAIFVFEGTTSSDRKVTGIDYLTVKDGMITDLTVFIRPMSGLTAVAEEMKAMLEAAGAI